MSAKTLIEVTPGLIICPADITAIEERTTDQVDRQYHHAAIHLNSGHTIRVTLKHSYRFSDLITQLFDHATPDDRNTENDTETETNE